MKILDFLHKIELLFVSRPTVGGLEISYNAIRYLLIRGSDTFLKVTVPLSPGIIENSRLANKELFISALKSLHAQITPLAKPLNVVVIIPSALVYTQSFSVPVVEKKQLEDTIDLNLQMLSPTRVEETYYDWQEIKENKDASHMDLLGAFAPVAVIQDYLTSLAEANFHQVAVEFPALSLSRLIKQRWQNLEEESHYLVIHVSGEGVLMAILKNGNLAFSHFSSWQDAAGITPGEGMTFEAVRQFFTQELQRLLTYYYGRTGKPLTEVLLLAPFFNYEIVTLAKEKFSLEIKNLTANNLEPSWLISLGAGLRGLISGAHDMFISLTELNTQTEFYERRSLSFVSIWRNIITATLILVLISYVTIDTTFRNYEKTLQAQTLVNLAPTGTREADSLKQNAQRFNQLITLIDTASQQEIPWSLLLIRFTEKSGAGIQLDRVFADSQTRNTLLIGRATNELTAINFKNRLEKDPLFEAVSLPLSNIRTEADGSAVFTITLKLKTLNF